MRQFYVRHLIPESNAMIMQYDFDTVVSRENTSSVKYDLREKIFGKQDVIPMWVADMDFPTPPCIIDAIKSRLQHEILGYTLRPESFYESVTGWNMRRHNWPVMKEWISFSPGVVPALNLIVMAFTEPGDKIIVQPPVYFPFFSAITNHGRIQVNNPLRYYNCGYTMDFNHLRTCIDDRTRMFILCNPHNPTGNVWSRDDLLTIAGICMEKNIIMLSDEIHSDLVYEGYKHIPLASLSPDIAARTITCMAPSKTFNLAGLSTSFLVIPDAGLRQKYDCTLENVHVGAGNIFGYTALAAGYDEGEDWLRQLMKYLQGNLDYLIDFMNRYIPQIKAIKPGATYMVWLDCRNLGMDKKELRDFMINTAGLGLSDGYLFGTEGEGFQRINIACPRSVLEQALNQLRNALSSC